MSTTLWIALAVVAVVVLGYFLVMRNLLHKSRDLDKRVDRSKLRKWEDDEKDE
jgi:hypothetical protein